MFAAMRCEEANVRKAICHIAFGKWLLVCRRVVANKDSFVIPVFVVKKKYLTVGEGNAYDFRILLASN